MNMLKKGFLVLLLIMQFAHVLSQEFSVSGKVLDAETKQHLAFVNIITNINKVGTTTDIDGKFDISANEKVEFLRLSYVGYESQTCYLHDEQRNVEISLKPASLELDEVVIVAGENPAHRIVKHVVENKDNNNPEKLSSFAYTVYDKMIFTVDTLGAWHGDFNPEDSADVRLRNFLNDKDLFIMETVSERKFMSPDRSHEKVLASRISGFRDPILLFLSSQLQPSSFYNELIKISDKNYVNPISGGSLKKYYFQLEDTTYTARGDSVFIISFRPLIHTNFDGLKGVLSINSKGWAIQNVIAEPAREEGGISLKIQQMYELINDSIWFPVQMNTDVIFKNLLVNNVIPIGKAKSYIMDIEVNPDLVKRQFNQISVEFDPSSGDRSEHFWLNYRGDSLSIRERRTYAYIDSIGREADLDKMAYTAKAMLNNRLPMGKIDLDLSRIIRYNSYEGLYLGLGLLTNRKLSRIFEAGVFWGYGFKDKTAKYGGNINIVADKYREINFRLNFSYAATETGGVKFYGEKDHLLNPSGFRNFLINEMDLTERKQASVSFRALRYGVFNAGFTSDRKAISNNYYFDIKNSIASSEKPVYTFTEISAGFRYAYKEKLMQLPDSRISLGTKYPVLTFQYTRGLSGVLGGEFTYNKFDLKIEKSFYIKYLGETKLLLLAGYIDQAIPQTNLYNGRGSYRVFTIYAPGSFATQRMNEFLASQYAFLFFTHNFGKLLWRTKKFSPEFAFATNAGYGTLEHPEYHKGIGFEVMDQGYFESGLLINNLLNVNGIYTLGLGAFYRYGYYHLPELADNFAYKITMVFPF